MGDKVVNMPFTRHISLTDIRLHIEQYIYGSITLALVSGLCAALLAFILLKLFNRKPASAF
jgi:hypothetical protein